MTPRAWLSALTCAAVLWALIATAIYLAFNP